MGKLTYRGQVPKDHPMFSGRVEIYQKIPPTPTCRDFYSQLKGATMYLLAFPGNDYELPNWDDDGQLIEQEETEWQTEQIEAVSLGNGRYRLACKIQGPLSMFSLGWGEEFLADEGPQNDLILRGVVVPQRYVHEEGIIMGEQSLSAWRGSADEQRLHSLGGGWENVGGMMTISVPVERYPD